MSIRTAILVAAMAGGLTFPALPAAAQTAAARAAPAGTCTKPRMGQYADTHTCVSSVLAPQADKTYGPDHLEPGIFDPAQLEKRRAWCEGVSGPGIGQSITLHQKQRNKIGSLTFVNGYAATPELFRANGRVKRARIDTSSGYSKTVTLKDNSEDQTIKLSAHKLSWARLTILEIYQGTRGSDTCVTTFSLNQEDFL